jgi:hypothetical protein
MVKAGGFLLLTAIGWLVLSASGYSTDTKNNVETKFGAPITLKEPIELSQVIKEFAKFEKKEILTTGTVAKVCEKKGCWMTINTDVEDVRVTFKDYGFFVPLALKDKPVLLQGQIEKKIVSVGDQKHLLEDAGAPKKEIDAITAPKAEFAFVATGVAIK